MAQQTGEDKAAETWLAAARAMAPLVAEHRDNFDRDRSLPAVLIEAMHRAGFFRLWLPRALGGVELDPLGFLAVTEELSRQDASVGWCETIAAGAARLAGAIPQAAAREIFGSGRGILAGVIAPGGTALAVAGGYQVSGRWSYASGIAHADWVFGNCIVADASGPRSAPEGGPEFRVCLMPRDRVEVLDVWHVGGMRATGSNDFKAAGLFVPESHAIALSGFSVPAIAPGPLFVMPPASVFHAGLATVALGCARGALEALIEIAAARKSPGSPVLLRDKPAVQIGVAQAEGLVRAGRALLFGEIESMWRNAGAGRAITLRDRVLARLAAVQATRAAIEAVDIAHELGGGAALQEGARLERCFRDVHAIGQHAALSAQVNLEPIGQVLLGLTSGAGRF